MTKEEKKLVMGLHTTCIGENINVMTHINLSPTDVYMRVP